MRHNLKKTPPKHAWMVVIVHTLVFSVVLTCGIWGGYAIWAFFFPHRPPGTPPPGPSISTPLPEPTDDPSSGDFPSLMGAGRGGENLLEDTSEINMKMLELESKRALLQEKEVRFSESHNEHQSRKALYALKLEDPTNYSKNEVDQLAAKIEAEEAFHTTVLDECAVLEQEIQNLEESISRLSEESTSLLSEESTSLLSEESTSLLSKESTSLLSEESTSLLSKDEIADLKRDHQSRIRRSRATAARQAKHARRITGRLRSIAASRAPRNLNSSSTPTTGPSDSETLRIGAGEE